MHIPRQEVSFAVTEDCNLNCSYCYLPRKNSGKKMTFETAKKAIDYFLASTGYFNVPRLIIDFIGGEPLLAIGNQSALLIKEALGKIPPGKTIIMVTHNTVIAEFANRLVVIEEGEIIHDGPPDTIRNHLDLIEEKIVKEINE